MPNLLLAGGALGVVSAGAGGCGMRKDPGTLDFTPQAVVQVGFALNSFSTIAIVEGFIPLSISSRAIPSL